MRHRRAEFTVSRHPLSLRLESYLGELSWTSITASDFPIIHTPPARILSQSGVQEDPGAMDRRGTRSSGSKTTCVVPSCLRWASAETRAENQTRAEPGHRAECRAPDSRRQPRRRRPTLLRWRVTYRLRARGPIAPASGDCAASLSPCEGFQAPAPGGHRRDGRPRRHAHDGRARRSRSGAARPRYRDGRKARYRLGRADPWPDGFRTRWTTSEVS